MKPFHSRIRSVAELESLIGVPGELVIRKQLDHLDDHMRAFVARSPLLLLGTVSSDRRCDVSPRGDLPSAAMVLDPKTIIIAERPGNRRGDSLRNILETGRAGLLFMVPGTGETLRVNGVACVMQDDEKLDAMSVSGRKPLLGIGLEVEECYFQCGKALIRSELWKQQSTGEDAEFDFAQALVDQTQLAGQTVESLKQQIETSYRERLY